MSFEHPYPDYAYLERDVETNEKRWFGSKGMGVCYVHEDRAAEDVAAAVKAERDACAQKAREFASNYEQGSDGRNTFVILAEWIESRGTSGNPAGRKEDTSKCVCSVSVGGRSPLFRQCSRKRGYGKDGLYCVQHAKRNPI